MHTQAHTDHYIDQFRTAKLLTTQTNYGTFLVKEKFNDLPSRRNGLNDYHV